MKKSVRYTLLGGIGALIGLIMIIQWTILSQPHVYEQTGIYYPLAPALPHLAIFSFMLSCLCFVFGYLESVREAKPQAGV